MWADVYPQLSEGKPGLLGAMIARAEAQTMRLACLYALLDRSSVIRADHLLAAVALWTYCEDSARWIFGDVLGDPVADEILRSLRRSPKGMTRTEIARLFSNHREKQELARALALLLEEGLVSYEKESTGGRPGERWRATTQGCEKSERSEETPAEDPSFA
jgi:DNA-binding transcriptional ArsR family regulator